MLKSLYSGISGLKNHQTRMDVLGNNIANVNTTGFKAGRVNFQDSLSQYYSNNPAIGQNQVGTGMKVASINNNFTQGAMQNTGRSLDLLIQGDGFFGVLPPNSTDNSQIRFTRDGVFFLQTTSNPGEYNVVNSEGRRLLGKGGSPIVIRANNKAYADAVAEAQNALGVVTSKQSTINGFFATSGPGTLDPSTATDPNIIAALTAIKTAMGTYTDDDSKADDSINTKFTNTDHTTLTGTDLENFYKEIVQDLKQYQTELTTRTNNAQAAVTQAQEAQKAVMTVGTLSIDSEGNITGNDTRGVSLIIENGQIALYNFQNRDGLKKEGGNLFSATSSSGQAEEGTASAANNNTINSGYLEMSNVDLSQEMVDMMVTQRGFQANSRIITVSDTLLEELVNLKR